MLWQRQRQRFGSIALHAAGAMAVSAGVSPVGSAGAANSAAPTEPSGPSIFLRVVGTPYAYQAPAAAQMVTVGRQRRNSGLPADEGNDLVIRVPDSDDQSLHISRRHLEIQRIGDECFVVDRSRAGTQLDGKALVKDQPAPLRCGSQIVLAGVITLEFLVQVDSLAINAQPLVNLCRLPARHAHRDGGQRGRHDHGGTAAICGR